VHLRFPTMFYRDGWSADAPSGWHTSIERKNWASTTMPLDDRSERVSWAADAALVKGSFDRIWPTARHAADVFCSSSYRISARCFVTT
jgi:hypothetical protein